MTKIAIFFAGVAGSSKSPIANYLSTQLNLPVINNDSIRTEVKEDLDMLDQAEYLRRRDERVNWIRQQGISYIFDASVDRSWQDIKLSMRNYGYESFVISLDLSDQLVRRIYTAKGYDQFDNLPRWQHDHQAFLNDFSDDISLHITDETFPDRLELSLRHCQNWLANLSR